MADNQKPRRRVLSIIGSVGLTGGCLSQTSPVGLRKIILVNLLSESETAEVVVRKRGEEVYREQHTVGSDPGESTTEITKDWMGDRATYQVSVSRESDGTRIEETSGSGSLPGDRGENSCYELNALLEESGIGMAHDFVKSCERTATGKD